MSVVASSGRPRETRDSFGFLRRSYAMLLKEFIQLRRDRVSFAMIVMIPVMQLLLFGYAINTTPRHLPSAVLLQEDSDLGRSILKAMENTSYFRFTREVHTVEEFDELLQSGKVLFGVGYASLYSLLPPTVPSADREAPTLVPMASPPAPLPPLPTAEQALFANGDRLPGTVLGLTGQRLRFRAQLGVELDVQQIAGGRGERVAAVRGIEKLGHLFVDLFADHLGDQIATVDTVQNPLAIAIDALTLLVHYLVVFEQILANFKVALLDLLLCALDAAGHHAAFDGLAFLHAETGE